MSAPANSAIVVRRCFVSGRVQGVFYRASTQHKATELAISGYARNLPDGRVEVLMAGTQPAVQALIDWLHTGPPAARVTQVDVAEVDPELVEGIPVGFKTT
jgi:acylphosphatase